MRRDWQDLNKRLRRELETTQEWILKQKSNLDNSLENVPEWLSYHQMERWQSSLINAFEKISQERKVKKNLLPKLYWLQKELYLQESILKTKALFELGQFHNQLVIQKILKIQEQIPKDVIDEIAREETQQLLIEDNIKVKSLSNQIKWNEFEDNGERIKDIENSIVNCEIALNTLEASRSVAQEMEVAGRYMNKGNGNLRSNKIFGLMGVEKIKKFRDSLNLEEKKLRLKLQELKEALLIVSDPMKRGRMNVVETSDLLYAAKTNFQECENSFIKATEIYQKIFS